ncbi:MAG: DNA-binding protein [Hyphomicrobiales bacterium]|nr:DNA-binding protein [Hyphomicrobiales bacterium]
MKKQRVQSTPNPDTDPVLASDILWGIPAIAKFIGRTPRQVSFLIQKGDLPAKKLGPRTICARKSELANVITSQT